MSTLPISETVHVYSWIPNKISLSLDAQFQDCGGFLKTIEENLKAFWCNGQGLNLIHIFVFDFQWPIRHAIVEDWDLMVRYYSYMKIYKDVTLHVQNTKLATAITVCLFLFYYMYVQGCLSKWYFIQKWLNSGIRLYMYLCLKIPDYHRLLSGMGT